jgi:hypothetical protein
MHNRYKSTRRETGIRQLGNEPSDLPRGNSKCRSQGGNWPISALRKGWPAQQGKMGGRVATAVLSRFLKKDSSG